MAHPTRILYLLWGGGLGGAERHVYDLVTDLPPDRFSPTVCFLSRADTFGMLLAQIGVPVVEMRLSSGYDFLGMLRFVRWLRKSRFELIHDHVSTPWARIAAGITVPNIPIISTEHSNFVLYILKDYNWKQRALARFSAQFTDQYIAVSSATKALLIKDVHIRPTKIHLIPNFVDRKRFISCSIEQRYATRQALGLPTDAEVLITIGRLIVQKGFDRLIDLLSPLFIARPRLHLVIVGDGSLRKKLELDIEQAQLGERVHLLGERLDVPELLNASDVFVLASRVETFGIVVAEAMMAGKAVVAPCVPAINEVVEDQRAGILVDDANLESGFAQAVAHLLDNPVLREQMGRYGRDLALTRYDRQTVVGQIIDLYKEVLALHRAKSPRV